MDEFKAAWKDRLEKNRAKLTAVGAGVAIIAIAYFKGKSNGEVNTYVWIHQDSDGQYHWVDGTDAEA